MTTSSAMSAFVELVDQKIREVLSQPVGWGGGDALEPLVLALVMLRTRATNPAASDRDVIRQYRQFLATRFGPGLGDLRVRLGTNATLPAMTELLTEFAYKVPSAFLDRTRERGAPKLPYTRPTLKRFTKEEVLAKIADADDAEAQRLKRMIAETPSIISRTTLNDD